MMKVKHSFLVFAAAFLMVMPAFAKTGVVYQRRIVCESYPCCSRRRR